MLLFEDFGGGAEVDDCLYRVGLREVGEGGGGGEGGAVEEAGFEAGAIGASGVCVY